MAYQKQAFLGKSAQGTLCLTTTFPPQPSFQTPPGNSPISKLSSELIYEILSYIPPRDPKWNRWAVLEREYRVPPFPLTLINKSWHQIYSPIFFREISFQDNHQSPLSLRTSKFLSLLQTRPKLRAYPQIFDLVFLSRPNASRNIAKIIELCPNVRIVALHSNFTSNDWPLLHAIINRRRLENLTLGGSSFGPSTSLILSMFKHPWLKTLSLSRYGIGQEPEDCAAPWRTECNSISAQELEQALPECNYGCGNVTSISLRDPSTPGCVTTRILRLSKRVEEVSIGSLSCSVFWQSHGVDRLQEMLDTHRNSLRSITLDIIPWSDPTSIIPNFKQYTCLEELRVSANNVFRHMPIEILKRLSAPRLSYLSFSFRTEDQNAESAGDFGPQEVEWMKTFASLKRDLYPGSRLRKLMVELNADEVPTGYQGGDCIDDELGEQFVGEEGDEAEARMWPWIHVENARQAVMEWGLEMEYTKPRWTREAWNRKVAQS